jgi:hypothetical protein
MPVTIEIPGDWAAKLQARGPLCSARSSLGQEGIEFLARGPSASEIATFHPSEATVARVGLLLDKHREGTLMADEPLELNEIAAWNRFFPS